MRGELWIVGQVGRLRRLGGLGGLGQVGWVRQVGQGENYEFWIGHKLQACASGGEEGFDNDTNTNNLAEKFNTCN